MILTVIITWFTTWANNRKSLISILKKFFFLKTKDLKLLDADANKDGAFKFKFKSEHKPNWCMYFCNCLFPACSKGTKKYNRIIKQGEEKLYEYVNARSIMGILNEHHTVLKEINTSANKLSDKIFDYYLYLSSNDDGIAPGNSLVQYNKAE